MDEIVHSDKRVLWMIKGCWLSAMKLKSVSDREPIVLGFYPDLLRWRAPPEGTYRDGTKCFSTCIPVLFLLYHRNLSGLILFFNYLLKNDTSHHVFRIEILTMFVSDCPQKSGLLNRILASKVSNSITEFLLSTCLHCLCRCFMSISGHLFRVFLITWKMFCDSPSSSLLNESLFPWQVKPPSLNIL